ncbi:integrin alpha-M [Octodon degus]|uniref:Integrin alpha-M n=1 Tax=Octodon degus TaxID=10160 RepID=A0A6P3EI82_OCTDE|nr:integrin alpha-M [Octodon degus]
MTCRVLLVTALALCHGFNLDTETPITFKESARGFGQTVVQLEGSRLVVGAPQEVTGANQTGGLYQCDYSTGRCEPVSLQVPPEAVNMSLGLTLAAATNPTQLLACGPTLHQTCKENTYVQGECFLFGSDLRRQPLRVPEELRGCPQQESDIAFLIDGSGSIHDLDFQQMKEFVSTVMEQFAKSKTLFSLMQYSDNFKTHFTFEDFKRNPNPRSLVIPINQLTGWTHTATGIRKVTRELFQSSSGARDNAVKILVVITDGQKYGDRLNYEDVIPEANQRNIIRYVIGVGDAFRNARSRRELDTIASAPPHDHVFQVNNFEALKTIQNQLQEKIFAIEGTQGGSTSSFEHEMSQEGFSAAITADGPLLGSVGSFDWAGGAFLYMSNGKVPFINKTRVNSDMNDAYLGYASAVITRNRGQNLVLGAPRYQHTGLVVMFRQNAGAWEASADIQGSQIGSYFGASLCSVDVDRDKSTDLVLIGAPHYYEPTRGGRVSVCPLPKGRARWRCEAVLQGEQGHPWGRFGAAMTVLGDVNGDQLTDVAIGAPGEQENQGAVYLFHGKSVVSISSSHSQRITGSQLATRLQYFGQSLSGGRDLTMDGLMDLAVGAQGHLFLLRSQPLLRVDATMNFTPREVARNVFECQEQAAINKNAGEVTVCLHVRKTTRDQLRGEVQALVSYVLTLDSGRPNSRAIFDKTKSSSYRQNQTLRLIQRCETLALLLPKCVDDSVSPIVLRLNYTLVGTPIASFGNLRPVLAEDAPKFFIALFPFEKNCGNDNICQDDLSVAFHLAKLQTVVVGDPQGLNVTLTVKNEGEDSYRTQVTLYYPVGLSYRKVSMIQGQRSRRSWSLACSSDSSTERPGSLKSASCSVNHPIFPDNSEITFTITFDVDFAASLGNKLLLKANVTSENNMPRTNKMESQLELPVKYAVYLIVTSGEASTKYLNFTASEKTSQIMEHQYQFSNLGKRSLPIKVVFWVPVRLNNEIVWDRPQVTFSPNLMSACSTEERPPSHSDFQDVLKKTHMVQCSIAVCQRIECDIPSFNIEEEFNVTLHGNLSFNWYLKTSSNHLLVVSTAEILFNNSVFTLLAGQGMFVRSQTETKVELYEVHNPLPLIVGSSIGGLVLLALITAGLYKLGFFKRQYKDMMSNAGPQEAPPQ